MRQHVRTLEYGYMIYPIREYKVYGDALATKVVLSASSMKGHIRALLQRTHIFTRLGSMGQRDAIKH